ncbi:hypothetical protein XM69_c12010 [Vibrio parahaemolyticus]|uniref:tyrosine-type recombinase/integrase n=1 Tax=Vibrio parahaemolyticus TaxID=670 RepID=UPI0009B6CD25|nr:tyrosine-type recombinase/integrase [Vibrio parahaemolyticus]OQK25771.1 hypothetical protein XM69_c12010 [Vibrio parahaemolyticus]
MTLYEKYSSAIVEKLGKQHANSLSTNPFEMTMGELSTANFPVTLDREGKPLSMWQDDSWNYIGLSDGNTNREEFLYLLTFGDEHSDIFKLQIKLIVYALFCTEYIERSNAKYGVYAYKQMKPLFIAMQNAGFKSVSDLSHTLKLHQLLEQVKGKYSKSTLSNSLGLLSKASRIYLPQLSFDLGLNQGKSRNVTSNRLKDVVEQYAKEKGSGKKQTLYIPNHVHSSIMENALSLIEEYEGKINDLCSLIKDNHRNSIEAKKRSEVTGKRADDHRKYDKDLKTTTQLIEQYGFTDEIPQRGLGINTLAGKLVAACYCVIATFTGMRYDEMTAMSTDSYQKHRGLHFIRSYESKVTGGQDVDYITSPVSERAFNILRALHEPTRELDPNQKGNNFLLLATKYKTLLGFRAYKTISDTLNYFIKYYNICVTADDMKQHRLFNTENATAVSGIGEVWPITTHQFRRTLVVNFITNDLGTLGAIKQQLKHLYIGMTEYYGKNSTVALALKVRQSHDFMKTLEKETSDLQIGLYKRLYYSDEILSGNKGKEIVAHRGEVEVKTDKQIRLLIKHGIFKVTRTPYGYCTKGDLCNKNDVIDPSFCGASCETMIITYENALNWQRLHKRNTKLIAGRLIEGFEGHKIMLKAQVKVAETIMDTFKLDY